MKKISRKKAGVNAIVGVILMVTITVAIAATVYVHVSDSTNKTNDTVCCGHIKYLSISENWDSYGILQMEHKEPLVVRSIDKSDYELLKFAYNNHCEVSFVVSEGSVFGTYVKSDSVHLIDCGCNR